MREYMTSALDVLGLLLFAAGAGFAAAQAWQPAGWMTAGLVLFAGSQALANGEAIATRLAARRRARREARQRRRSLRAWPRAAKAARP